MAKPEPQPAIVKAPTRGHPVVPLTALTEKALPTPATKGTEESSVLFSTRLRRSTQRRLKMYAASSGERIQTITEAAIEHYLDRQDHTPTP